MCRSGYRPRAMPLLTALILALGLSMDAVAVSISAGLSRPDERFLRTLRMPLVFGAFQALMPAIGWIGGEAVKGWVERWGTWIAVALLLAIGGKMLWEAWHDDDDEAGAGSDPFAWRPLLLLGLATSIDALAAGLSISLVGLPPTLTIAIIGVTTALLCIPAVALGARLGCRWASRAEYLGGGALVAIAAKLVWDRLAG